MIQVGYIANGTEELSGGIFAQTNIDYRSIRNNLIFRINFDGFGAAYTPKAPQTGTVSFEGDIGFTETVGGIGYKIPLKKHSILLFTQAGQRGYGYPEFNTTNGITSVKLAPHSISTIRFSIGHEFELEKHVFTSFELFWGQTLERKDYWVENPYSSGFTVGLTTLLW